jgi:hypothetical protein
VGGYNYVLFGRMAYYFQFSIFIGVPCMYQELRKNKGLLSNKTTGMLMTIKFLLLIVSAINFYVVFYLGNYGNLFPYIFK